MGLGTEDDALWVFGYGSLVFRPGFPYQRRVPAFVEGWARRFWQASPDHRGTPQRPGRVVTLVREPGRCWGMAYRLAAEVVRDTLESLDYREKAGYERHSIDLHTARGVVAGLVYVAGPTNPNFLGPSPTAEIAAHIVRSHGPSGPNREYVLRLAEALREMQVEDPHTFELERQVLELIGAGA